MYTSRDPRSQSDATSGRSLSAYTYGELKRRLLMGDFALGRPLRESQLGNALGVSRTPVREALSRLHAEGLLIRLPEGSLTPAAPDLHTIAELYEVRRSLEFTAFRRGDHDRKALADLHQQWSEIEAPASDEDCSPDFVLQDEAFHIGLAAASGNRSLTDLLRQVNERIRFVRMHDFLTTDRVVKTIGEHLGIVDGLLADEAEPERSLDRLRSHLEISERVVEQRAAFALSRMVSGVDRG